MTPYYEQDGVTIYHGDCREILFRDPAERGRCDYDLLLTDPPYGINFAGQPTKWQRRAGHQPRDWDTQPADGECLSVVRACSRHQVIWGGNYFDLPPSRCWLSWHKPDAPPSMGNVEYAWTNMDQNSRQITVTISATNAERVGHPTQKPEAVMRWALLQTPADVRTVLDPFMGSGTTLVAAKRLGRRAVGIEINEEYCEIAARRLQQGALALFGEATA